MEHRNRIAEAFPSGSVITRAAIDSIAEEVRLYVIFIIARSGSTLLTQLAERYGLGTPQEWFNEDWIHGSEAALGCMPPRALGVSSADDYVKRIARQYRSEERIFGLQLSQYQTKCIANMLEDCGKALQAVKPFYLRRRNLVAQAISLDRSIRSGLFHSYQKSPDLISKYNALDYDPDSIEHCLRHLRADEIFFNNLFVEKGISPVNIFYEDLVEDPESVLAEMKQVIAGQSVRQAIARSGTLEKLADEKSAEWERRFRLERSGIIQNIELDRLVDMRSHQIEQVITLSTTDTNVVTPASESMPIGRTETPFGTMVYLPNDDPIGESLARYGEWAKAEIELVSHFIPMGSTVIDVGANIGTHSLAFAQYTGRTGRVIAIEPQPAVFDILARNVAENGLSQIDLIQSGASSSSGEMFFSRLNYSGHINSGAIALDSTSGETRVDVITLDSLQLECCAFVKVDAEGMEFDVLKGAVDLIRRSAPTLLMEVNTVDRAIELNRFVSELGYSVFFARTKAFNSDNFKRETDNFFGVATETSLLCIHKSKGWPRIPESSLFDVYPIESADRLAALFISSPRFGDLTEHDRDADWLRDELKHEKASHHEAMSKLESALYRSTLLDRQVDALDAEIKVLKQQVQQYMERSAKLLVAENQIATLQSELNREKEFGQMILRSSSWRLTRPLRVARRFLKI